MKFRTKAISYISLVSFLFFVVLLSIALFVVQPSYNRIEKQESQQATTQTMNAINYALLQLKGNLLGYSEWDDTYNFVLTNNQSYVANNFIDDTFEQGELNLVAIVNNNRGVAYVQSFDLNSSTKVPTSPATIQTLTCDGNLWGVANATVSGIVRVDNQAMLIVAAPILTSLGEGPPIGRMMFGQYLGTQKISQLQAITSVRFSMTTLSYLASTSNQITYALQSNPNAVFTKTSGNSINNYFLVNDIDSNPTFVLEISLSRATYQEGVWVEDIFILAAVSLSISFGLIVGLVLEKEIVKPITGLAVKIKSMPLQGRDSTPDVNYGIDEINVLAASAEDSLTKKFEAMSEVSRMVGHDLRNPLAAIKMATYILKKNYSTRLDDKGNDQLKIIDGCVEYSDKIVRDLLDYSCDIKPDSIPYSPKKIIDEVLATFNLPSNFQVINELTDEPKVSIDNQRMLRVFSNLIKNATDAMPNGGVLRFANKIVNGDVAIAFSDSGVGMSDDTLKKLWTPFFTTKAKGMGIGLSICKKIVESHKGKIEVSSTLGKGTTFTVFLPVAKG